MRQRVQWQQVLSQGVEEKEMKKGFCFFLGGGGVVLLGLSSIFHMTADTIDLDDTHPSVFHINQEKFQIQQFD